MTGLTAVFDLDGTLVDSADDLVAATNHTLGTIGLKPIAGALIRTMIGNGARAMLRRALEASRPGEEIRDTELDTLQAHFFTYYGANIAVHSRIYPDVIPVLEGMRQQGCRLAVCTNKTERLARQLLKELDLLSLFHAVTGKDTLPVFKPDPGHLIGTIILADGDLANSVMIGDSETDVKTAKAAGIPVVGVTFGYATAPMASYAPDAMIAHYRDLIAAIERAMAAAS
jgi:phosphoglycolate phosphatase